MVIVKNSSISPLYDASAEHGDQKYQDMLRRSGSDSEGQQRGMY
jgi:hypothetical protein